MQLRRNVPLDTTSLVRVFYFMAISFVIAMAATPLLTDFLYKYKMSKKARMSAITGEKASIYASMHGAKHRQNIPTMAGVLIWVTVLVVTLLFNLSRSGTYLPLFTLVAFGMLGLFDDLINTKGKNSVGGITFKTKLFATIILASAGAWWFYFKLDWSIIHIPASWIFNLPGFVDIGLWYIPFFILVIIASANAVNITDGLDGLAGGLVSIAFGVYTIIALAQGKVDLALFTATITGATLAYLWFNIYPARFFMGDTGSLALGATLGVVAMLTNTALVLPLIGLVFVLDTISVILQVFWKKVFKRKLFPISPLHHTLEYVGWPEFKVTMRLWLIGAMAGVIGLLFALADMALPL